MKKVILAVAVIFLVGSCSSLSLPSIANPTQVVNVAGTEQANLQIAVAQTLTAQPTSTSLPPTATTENLFATPLSSDTETPSPTTAGTADTSLTATFDVATSTNAPATISVGSPTATWTLAVRTYGTLPPLVPFAHITLINKAKAEAYISMHVDLDGSNTVIEYPVTGTTTIRAPLGFYRYVAWVGGREMVGEFRLHNGDDLTITLYKDKIVIK